MEVWRQGGSRGTLPKVEYRQAKLNPKKPASMLKNLKSILLFVAVFFLFAGMGTASAHSKDKHDDEGWRWRPEIKEATSSDSHSVDLKIKDKENKGEKVKVKVKITNKKTGVKYTEKFKKVKLNCDGKGKIHIDGLKIGTDYCFKIKVKGPCECEYSCKSKCKCVQVDP